MLLAVRLGLIVSLAFAILGAAHGQTPPSFSNIIVFGDSLSDVDNVANVTSDESFGATTYPSNAYNYADGQFTNDTGTTPGNTIYGDVWHRQLAVVLGLPKAKASTDGGLDYAYGGATTQNGTRDITVISNPVPFAGGQISITVKNMGQQVSDYLSRGVPDASALFILWGGGNDLFNDSSAANVTAAANNVSALVEQLARAGAVNFLVPNVPPLGDTPHYLGGSQQAQLNQASASFRDQLNANLDSLQARLAAAGIPFRLYRLDVYNLFMGLVQNPASYNFTNVTQSAQGQHVSPDSYLFWDDIHPTTAGHFQIANEAFRVLTRPDFFKYETALNGGVEYLSFSDGVPFGYYSYLSNSRYLYHYNLGFEYVVGGNDGNQGAYMFDFTSGHFFYTSPAFPFPYLYDFSLNAFLYYYPSTTTPGQYTTSPRYFYNFATHAIISE